MKNIQTATHEISIDKQGIVTIKVREGAHVEEDTLKQADTYVRELAGTNKLFVLIDARSFHTLTPEATAFLRNNLTSQGRIASAVVSNTVGIRLVVDYMSKGGKVLSPVRMFENEAEARTWLMSFKTKK